MKKINNTYIILILIVLLGVLLRSYKVVDNFPFSAELGDNLLDIKNALEEGTIPLLGPPTSHPWLSFGPLYYWIMMPILTLFNNTPTASLFVGITAGSVLILINYFVIKDIFREKVALLSSLLIAISPLFIVYSRASRFYFLTVILFYPFIWLLYKLWQGEKKQVIWLGLTFSLFFNFHFSPVILIFPVFILFYLKGKMYIFEDYVKFTFGSILGLIPLIIHDARNGFEMFSKLIMWFPYRVLGFIGLVPNNNFDSKGVEIYIGSLSDFLGSSFVLDFNFKIFAAFLFLVIISVYTIINLRRYAKDFIVYFFLTFFWLTLFVNFIHLDVPVHYFLPIFPLPLLFVSYLVVNYWNKKYVSSIFVGILFLALVINTVEMFLNYQYYGSTKISLHPHFIPYEYLVEVSGSIVEDANGKSFSLKRVGPYDAYEENYSQNYKYLMWLNGNEPQRNGEYEYTIFEDSERALQTFDSFAVGDIIIVRREIK